MKLGLVQLSVGPVPESNLSKTEELIRSCAASGAEIVFTPEVTNILGADGALQKRLLRPEDEDISLSKFCDLARELSIWLQIGSLALQSGDIDGRFANRGFLISPTGCVAARYDKIHMFDVQLTKAEGFRESARYRPGETAVVADAGAVKIGLSICYDLRFPSLYRSLAQAGAHILSVPSAFAQTTGQAHWHVLNRARAIENGCFVVAAAQTGEHGKAGSALRKTYGHSLIVDPWGEVVLDMGEELGHAVFDIDLAEVDRARSRVPSLNSDREFEGP